MAVTPAEMGFPHVLQLARLERIRVLKGGKQEAETVWLITSLSPAQADAPRLLALARQYWSIENGLHYRLAEISWMRSRFRLFSRPRWRKSLENRARFFESVQVETYPLPDRSATVIHCRPTTCFCAITLARKTARCIATGA
jgi:hypothetical protein